MVLTVRILFTVLMAYLGCDHCSECRQQGKAATGRNSIRRILDETGSYNAQQISDFDRAPVCGRVVFPKDELRREVNGDNNSTDIIEDDSDLDKIIGGRVTFYGEVPWMANLLYDFKHRCGATILNAFWIVTAAHCIDKGKRDNYRVAVGDYTLGEKDAFEVIYKVDLMFKHEDFDIHVFDYDIAVIKILPDKYGRGIQFNDFVQPVCLAYSYEYPSGGEGMMIAGWGKVGYAKGQELSKTLKKGSSTVWNYDECKRAYPLEVTPNMFCAGTQEGTPASCHGDSGGPAYYPHLLDGANVLFGVQSFGAGCGDPTKSSVMSSIPKYRGWIENQIRTFSLGTQGLLPVRRKNFGTQPVFTYQ